LETIGLVEGAWASGMAVEVAAHQLGSGAGAFSSSTSSTNIGTSTGTEASVGGRGGWKGIRDKKG
jgi:hypothetical protein